MIAGEETIAAVSTAFGRGGIAVIRISGADAIAVAAGMFRPRSGKSLTDAPERFSVYGDILCDGEVTDDGIAVIYRAPRSYTGEDTVEISCHGGVLLTERVLRSAYAGGARPALAGEFTQRAFVNGRIDLTKAEAVIGLIDARSEEQIRLNASHMSGVLQQQIRAFSDEIRHIISSVYVCIDYPDEDLEELPREAMVEKLESLLPRMRKTLATYREGRAVGEGIPTVILGKPNVGKSSLMNRLLGEERAIVTPIAGTTRDTVEERLLLGRVQLNICDTAGIRETGDEIEQIGVKRALRKAEEAELILALFDSSRPLDEEDSELGERLAVLYDEGKTVLALMNKGDCPAAFAEDDLRRTLFAERTVEVLSVSAETGAGVEALTQSIEALYVGERISYSEVAVLANARQHAAMQAACEAVERARDSLFSGFGTDTCGLDLERALASLGEMDGRAVSEEITDEIFHRFCVGK